MASPILSKEKSLDLNPGWLGFFKMLLRSVEELLLCFSYTSVAKITSYINWCIMLSGSPTRLSFIWAKILSILLIALSLTSKTISDT